MRARFTASVTALIAWAGHGSFRGTWHADGSYRVPVYGHGRMIYTFCRRPDRKKRRMNHDIFLNWRQEHGPRGPQGYEVNQSGTPGVKR